MSAHKYSTDTTFEYFFILVFSRNGSIWI